MKKKKSVIFLFLAVLFVLGFMFGINQSSTTATVYIENKKLDSMAKIKNSRALLPVREFYEQDEYKVHWDKPNQTITIQKDLTIIKVPLNKNYAYINDKKVKLDAKAKILNDKAYIPVRFISETMGYEVEWQEKEQKIHIWKNHTDFDVVVIGAEPEGISAAISAAREGQKTLLIDKRNKIGGLFTIAQLNSIDMNMYKGNLITRGIFEEFYNNIGKRTAFDVIEAQKVFDDMVGREPNITVVLNAKSFSPVVKNGSIQSLVVETDKGNTRYNGKQFIDSTADGDIAYMAGESFTFGQEDYRQTKETMAVTLVFELAGVDYDRVFEYLNYEDDNQATGADKVHAWGYPEMYDYVASQSDVSIRALNIGLQNNGNVLINALWISDIDGTDASQLEEAKQKAIKELNLKENGLISFINENLVGFEKAKLVGYADEIYVRETRHLNGQYRLTADDTMENRDFPDKIAFGNYPLDVQASATQKDFIVGNPQQYSIPFRSIVPKKIDNLLVASRASSYDSLAHGSARVVPIGMTVGQAAGVASAYANKNNVDFITMAQEKGFGHVQKIQGILNQQGAHLNEIPKYENPIMEHWAYDAVKFFRKYGVVYGGYGNEYYLNDTVTKEEFKVTLTLGNERSLINKTLEIPFAINSETLKAKDLHAFLEANDITSETETLKKVGKMKPNKTITKDVMLMFLYDVLKK